MVIDRVAREVAKDKTEEDRKGDMLRQTGDALAKALGPIRRIFDIETTPTGNGGSLYEKLSLKSFVKNLSVDVVAAFLKSSALDLRVENEAYYLLCAWIYQCPHLKEGGDKREGGRMAARTTTLGWRPSESWPCKSGFSTSRMISWPMSWRLAPLQLRRICFLGYCVAASSPAPPILMWCVLLTSI